MRRNPDFVLREIYGKNILMPIRYNEASNDPIYFNEVATSIWKLSENAESLKDILRSISQIYQLQEGAEEIVAIKDFLNQLIENKLIIME